MILDLQRQGLTVSEIRPAEWARSQDGPSIYPAWLGAARLRSAQTKADTARPVRRLSEGAGQRLSRPTGARLLQDLDTRAAIWR